MALVFVDRVKVRSHSTGTGSFVLENAVFGFQDFEAIGDGNETYYTIIDSAGNWEIGRGTYTSSTTTLSRDTILDSSNAGSLVNFPATGKTVFTTFPGSLATALVVGAGLDLTSVAQNILPAIDSDGTTGYTLGSSSYKWKELSVASINLPGDIKQSTTTLVVASPAVDTVIYTSTGQYQHSIKMFVQVEGAPDGETIWQTQACDIIAVKGFVDNIVHITAYGVTYSGAGPLATFDGQWNSTSNRIEITCQPTSTTNDVTVKVHALELRSND